MIASKAKAIATAGGYCMAIIVRRVVQAKALFINVRERGSKGFLHASYPLGMIIVIVRAAASVDDDDRR